MHTIASDLRHAVRRIKTAPGFVLVAVTTLALGIASTTALYSVLDALMLRPLPYRDPGRLVDVGTGTGAAVSGLPMSVTAERMAFWRGQTQVFEQVEAYRTMSLVLAGDGEPQSLIGTAITDGLMRMLGVAPQAGRLIEPGDGTPGRERVVVISDGLWRARFGAAGDIVGRAVRLDNTTYTVIGVMPASFGFPYGKRQFWVPQVLDPAPTAKPVRLTVTARLQAGLTRQEAQAGVDALTPRLLELKMLQPGFGIQLTPPMGRHVNAPVRRALYILAAAVSLVLLIACANLANLLLVQGAGRGREMAVRLALGASRGRLVRQLLTETVLLAALGGAAGLLLAQWTIDLLAVLTPREMTFLTTQPIALDRRVLAFAVALTMITAAVFGMLPALRASRLRPNEALKEGRSATAAPPQERLRRAFVLGQVALSLLLLFGAGLLTRTFTHLTRIDPGFDPAGVITVDLSLPQWKYGTRAAQQQFFDEVSARVRSLPQVQTTTLTGGVPPSGGGISFDLRFEVEGRGVVLEDPELLMPFSEVDGDYFRTIGIPLKAGRTFDGGDTPEAPRAVILGESMAKRLWPEGNAVGARIRFDEGRPWYTVVGVAGDVYQFRHDLPRGQFAVYYANSQSRGIPGQQTLVIRATGDTQPLVPQIRQAIWSVDRDQPIARVQTIETAYAEFFATPRFYAFLMSAFAGIGLIISTVGLYGVLAYGLAQRTREFGIRTALGAQRGQVMQLALRAGLTLTGAGIVLGLLGSVAVGRAMQSLLVEVSPVDPLTYAATVALLVLASAIACWVPARRATRVNPIVALREE
jgi:putative ABC transport system permease protein